MAFLLVAAIEMDATRAYGRTVGSWGGAGAMTVVHHALLLPNQSAMVLAAAMGAPVELFVGESGISITLGGIETTRSSAAQASCWSPAWMATAPKAAMIPN